MSDTGYVTLITGIIGGVVVIILCLIKAVVVVVKAIKTAKEELGIGQKKVADKIDTNTRITTDMSLSQADTASTVRSALRDATNASTQKENNIKKALDIAAADLKQTVIDTTADQNEKLAEIHSLVNGKTALILTDLAISKNRVADLTGHPDDIDAAKQAEQIRDEHLTKIKGAK